MDRDRVLGLILAGSIGVLLCIAVLAVFGLLAPQSENRMTVSGSTATGADYRFTASSRGTGLDRKAELKMLLDSIQHKDVVDDVKMTLEQLADDLTDEFEMQFDQLRADLNYGIMYWPDLSLGDSPRNCEFGEQWVDNGFDVPHCGPDARQIGKYGTVWDVACSFGNCWRYRELCIYRFLGRGLYRVFLPAPGFNYRSVKGNDRAGAC